MSAAGVTQKVYIVQKVRPDGSIAPDILAVKLRHLDAHIIAKQLAPAMVKAFTADKTDRINGETPDAAEQAAEVANGADWHLDG